MIDMIYQINIRDSIGDVCEEMQKPSFLFKPRLFLDGNEYCCLYGEDIMSGCAGFGNSPRKAMMDFDNNWFKSVSV